MDDQYRRRSARDEFGGQAASTSRPSQEEPRGGLLSRFQDTSARKDGQDLHGANGLLARAQQLRKTLRATAPGTPAGGTPTGSSGPRAGEWKASDFSPDELEDWDRQDAAPFELPPDPDAPERWRGAAEEEGFDANADWDEEDDDGWGSVR
jgi:hypothetical protein